MKQIVCDRCGAVIPEKELNCEYVNGEHLDLCRSCYADLLVMRGKLTDIKREMEAEFMDNGWVNV